MQDFCSGYEDLAGETSGLNANKCSLEFREPGEITTEEALQLLAIHSADSRYGLRASRTVSDTEDEGGMSFSSPERTRSVGRFCTGS